MLAVELQLHGPGEGRPALSAPVAYAQLADALGVPLGSRVPIAALRETVLQLRGRKGMVLDPADPDSVSVGSFFTNPIVERVLRADAAGIGAALADHRRRARHRRAARRRAAAARRRGRRSRA